MNNCQKFAFDAENVSISRVKTERCSERDSQHRAAETVCGSKTARNVICDFQDSLEEDDLKSCFKMASAGACCDGSLDASDVCAETSDNCADIVATSDVCTENVAELNNCCAVANQDVNSNALNGNDRSLFTEAGSSDVAIVAASSPSSKTGSGSDFHSASRVTVLTSQDSGFSEQLPGDSEPLVCRGLTGSEHQPDVNNASANHDDDVFSDAQRCSTPVNDVTLSSATHVKTRPILRSRASTCDTGNRRRSRVRFSDPIVSGEFLLRSVSDVTSSDSSDDDVDAGATYTYDLDSNTFHFESLCGRRVLMTYDEDVTSL